jgi:agmatine deiminase
MSSDSEANVVYISDLLEPRYPTLVDRLRGIFSEHGVPLRVIQGTKDIWCRDYMPVQVAPRRFVQFRYAPDYLVGFEDLITRPSDIETIPGTEACHQSEIILDGGNVVRSGDRCILTDKVFRENDRVGRDHLLGVLRDQLRVNELIVIPTEPGDVVGHADGMVRFLDVETVFVNDYSQVDPSFRRRLLPVLRRAGLNLIELPYCPEAEATDGIPSAVGCYANFLMVRGLIIQPTFGIPEDDSAERVMLERAQKYAFASIDCLDLAQEGGVLNCVTWTIVAGQQEHQISIDQENFRE